MNRKRQNLTSKLVILILALMTALTAMSVGYAKWSDSAVVDGKIKMGTWDSELIAGINTGITVYDENTLEVSVPALAAGGSYQATFQVHNYGTVPVRIQTLEYDGSTAPEGVDIEVTGFTEGDYVNKNSGVTGYVTVTNNNTATQEDSGNTDAFDFTITVERVLWDSYVP